MATCNSNSEVVESENLFAVFTNIQVMSGTETDINRGDVFSLSLSSFNQCEKMCTLPKPNAASICLSDTGELYASGLGENQDEVWVYNVENKTWNQAPCLNHRRSCHSMNYFKGCAFVLGGKVPERADKMVRVVEQLDTESGIWRETGDLLGDGCLSCCNYGYRDDIIVYGSWFYNIHRVILQIYSPALKRVTHKVSHPSNGILSAFTIAGDNAIVVIPGETYICPVKSIYEEDDNAFVRCPLYKSPLIHAMIFSLKQGTEIVLIGGEHRGENGVGEEPSCYLYRAGITDIVENTGQGWMPVKCSWPFGHCCVFAGKYST